MDGLDDASFLQASTISSHYEYPPMRERSHRSRVSAVPESSSKVISALRDLQEKIKRMELERTAAERRLKSLSKETTQYRDVLSQKRTESMETSAELSQRTRELQSQLAQAESRCSMVEKQLEHMRKLVQRAERERDVAVKQRDLDSAYTSKTKERELQSQQDRLNQLERERQRLKVTQSAAEGKIRDLEERILEEQHQRKLIQDRAAELQTVAETNRILLEAEKTSTRSKRTKKKTKSKRQDPRPVTTTNVSPQHIRANIGKIPFVAGQSTTPSHSINANLQNMLALLKTHNPAWCANGVNSPHGIGPPRRRKGKVRRVASSGSASDNGDLSDLLQCLQDEFGVMGCEHQELAKQVQEAEDSNLREDLERELDQLVTRMELKGQQISKLKRHQEKLSAKRTKTTKASPKRSKGQSKKESGDSEVQVITTVRTKGRGARPIRVDRNQRQQNVKMLRDMQTLQTSLRKDDLSWD